MALIGTRRTGGGTSGMTDDCEGMTAGMRRTGAISSSSSSEIVIGECETVVSSSSEITVGEWALGEMTVARGAGGGTDAGEITVTTGAEGVRGAGAIEADALERSSSMKCV